MPLALLLAACAADETAAGLETRPTVDAGLPDAPAFTGPAAFRFDSLALIDPHIHVLAGLACVDATLIVNGLATRVLQVDGNQPPDGLLDGSLALVFDVLDTSATARNSVDLVAPSCSAPAATSTCTGAATTPRVSLPTVNQATGSCLEVIEGSATDVPRVPVGPCFATEVQTFELDFLGTTLTLRGARGAARYDGDRLRDGLIRGFLDREDAEALELAIPQLGTRSLASFLEGGGSCRDSVENPRGDRDVGPGGEDGWWVYVAFTAVRVPWTWR
jgi:hypothetical protein